MTGLVLAGGASRRMGRPKALLDLGGKPLAEWVLDALDAVCDTVYLSVADGAGAEALAFLGRPLVVDRLRGGGPLGGLLAAQAVLPGEDFLLVGCDQPFIAPNLLRALRDLARAGDGHATRAAACARGPRLEPLPAVYPAGSGGEAQAALACGRGSLGALLAGLGPRVLEEADCRRFDPDLVSFRNLNRPADYEEALARLSLPRT